MSLEFHNKREITPNNLASLSEAHLEQLRMAGKPVYGKHSDSAAETLAQTFAAEEEGEGNAELWQVLNSEKHTYDCWVFDVDSAMVFEANTPTDTGVGMIQFHFEVLTKTRPELEALAKALQKAFDQKHQ
jgi:hypothetical protein